MNEPKTKDEAATPPRKYVPEYTEMFRRDSVAAWRRSEVDPVGWTGGVHFDPQVALGRSPAFFVRVDKLDRRFVALDVPAPEQLRVHELVDRLGPVGRGLAPKNWTKIWS
jgi:hypothetical protein